jgi:hypothetical protein
MLRFTIVDDRYFSLCETIVFLAYHRFMVMIGDDLRCYLMLPALPISYLWSDP